MSESRGDVSRFSSVINGARGLTKKSHFKVMISPPPFYKGNVGPESLEYLCSAAEVPPAALEMVPYKRQGYGLVTLAPVGVYFSDATLRFYCDNTGKVLSFFDDWLNYIVDFTGSKSVPYEISYRRNYVTTITITIFDDNMNPVRSIALQDAFPYAKGTIYTDWEDGNKLMDCPVRFAYKNWKPVPIV